VRLEDGSIGGKNSPGWISWYNFVARDGGEDLFMWVVSSRAPSTISVYSLLACAEVSRRQCVNQTQVRKKL
jgi:hypothetical protein